MAIFASVKICLIHDVVLPPRHYGGTERVILWLAKGLIEKGIDLTLVCRPNSFHSKTKIIPYPKDHCVEQAVPGQDVYHYFSPPPVSPEKPYVVTIGGNGKPGEGFLPNTVFVSRNHAERHGAQCFVYNGVDPDEYIFSEEKEDYLLFLAKASWKVKNVRGAIRIARATRQPLRIVGGSRWPLRTWRGVSWEGMLSGVPKARIISKAKMLLFPVLWNEPFGLAVVESLISGTPVIATRAGSLPELVPKEVGILCQTQEEFEAAVNSKMDFSAKRCREWALENFNYRKMTSAYLSLYEKVLAGESLNSSLPQAADAGTSFPYSV